MKSLESSCQEADYIINDTLLKLKNHIVPTNNSPPPPNLIRQPAGSTVGHNRQQKEPKRTTYQKLTTSASPNSSLLNHNSITQVPNQPPAYIFNGYDSQPDCSNYSKLINEDDSFRIVSVTNKEKELKKQLPEQQSQSQMESSSTTIISNVNSIISPSPVVPEALLSTQIEQQNSVDGINLPSLRQPDIISVNLNQQNTNIQLLTSTSNNNEISPMLNQSPSLPKRPRLTTAVKSTSIQSLLLPPPLQQPNSSLSSQLHVLNVQNTQAAEKPNVMFAATTTTTENPTEIAREIFESTLKHNISQKTQLISSVQVQSLAQQSHVNVESTSSGTSSPIFFDLFDQLRELYLYLLIHDEKSITENRRRHRTRSFVLEKLVEREKLNTIVLNLHPGNKGYSLAFYQDGTQIELINSETNNANNNNIYTTGDTTKIQIDRETMIGSTIAKSNKNLLNSTTIRTKQKQIGVNSQCGGVTSLLANNNFGNKNNTTITSNCFLDFEIGDDIYSYDCDEDPPDSILIPDFDEGASVNTNVNDPMNITALSNDAVEDNDNINLVEVMRWPYEIEDLLIAIDNEELPQIFSDLLETRMPNVFYSGCVICEVRDFRQTFPISSNSCDIFHVLLRPTNDKLFADVNQLQNDSNISSNEKLQLESQLVLATAEPLCLDPDPRIGAYAINMQFKRQMWNTQPIRRQMKKYSQISINRKRKTDQFTHNYGLELHEYLQRMRQRTRTNSAATNYNSSNALSGIGGVLGNNNKNVNISNTSSSSTGGNSIAGSIGSSTSAVLSSSSHVSTKSHISATTLSAFLSKVPKKFQKTMRPLRTPNLDYPPLAIPTDVQVERYAKAYERPRETKDCMPQLVEEYILERDREDDRVYHIKLSIYQRPANSEYFGELYVDRDYRVNERNGESCSFPLGTRSHANRYIQQFTEIFTEEGRKSVKISHVVPGQTPTVSYTTGMFEHRKQQQQQALAAALVQQQLHQTMSSTNPSQHQQQLVHIQPAPQLIAPNPNSNISNLIPNNIQHQQLNINLQDANIVGITSAGNANLHQLRQQLNHSNNTSTQQFIDARDATIQLQAQPISGSHHHLGLANGSLVLVQQQGQSGVTTTGLAIQNSGGQKKLISTNQLSGANTSLRAQLGSNVPILQAQLKAGPLLSNQQQYHNLNTKTMNSKIPNINALVTGFINSANQFQQQQQSQKQQQTNAQQKTSGNAAILSLLNSAPAAMTSTPVASSTFTTSSGQQPITILQAQQQKFITTDNLIHQQQQQKQRHQNAVIQNLLHSTNLRKINMITTISNNNQGNRLISSDQTGNIIAVNMNQEQDIHSVNNLQQHQHQNVRVTMSALASQLASPPAIMTNANFGYPTSNTVAAAQTNNNNITMNNNNIINNNSNIKILNNSIGQRIPTQLHRRDSSNTISMAAPSTGSDLNQSNHLVASTNLGFAMPGLSALLATSPSPSSKYSQQSGSGCGTGLGNIVGISSATLASNQALLERLNSGTNHIVSTCPSLSPQLPPPQQQKNIVQQQIIKLQSPASSISPMSSPPPPPQPLPQLQQQEHIQISSSPIQHNLGNQTTTLNLQGINISSLQGAMATFPGLQNVQVQIPGLNQPISLSLSGASLATAVHQQQNAIATAAVHQNSSKQQQTTSLLVSVPVTSTTQVNSMQTVSGSAGVGNNLGINSSATVLQVPISSVAAGTQTVVLTTAPTGNGGQGQTHSLSLAQLVASGVKMNPQALRAAASLHHHQQQQEQQQQQHTSNIIQSNTGIVNIGSGGTVNLTNTNVNVSGGSNVGNIQLLGTLQQRPRSIQVVGSKQLNNRGHLQTSQRNFVTATSNASGQTLKIATSNPNIQQITSTGNLLTDSITAEKLQLRLQKQTSALQQQLQQHESQLSANNIHQQVHQQQQQQRILTSAGVLPATIAVANQSQKQRRSATDVNK